MEKREEKLKLGRLSAWALNLANGLEDDEDGEQRRENVQDDERRGVVDTEDANRNHVHHEEDERHVDGGEHVLAAGRSDRARSYANHPLGLPSISSNLS